MIAIARFAVLYYRYNDNLSLPGFLTHGIQTPLTQFGRSLFAGAGSLGKCTFPTHPINWVYITTLAIIPFVGNLRMFLKPIRGKLIQWRGALCCWNNRTLFESMESMHGYKSSTSRELQRKKIDYENDFFVGWIIFQPPSVVEENESMKIFIRTTRGVINQIFFIWEYFFYYVFLYLFSK